MLTHWRGHVGGVEGCFFLWLAESMGGESCRRAPGGWRGVGGWGDAKWLPCPVHRTVRSNQLSLLWSNQSLLNLKCASILTIAVNSLKRSKPVGCTAATHGHFIPLSNLN